MFAWEKQDHDHGPPTNPTAGSSPLPWLEEEEDEGDDILDADGIEYITSDGERMAESDLRRKLMNLFIEGLDAHFAGQDVYASGNNFIHYQQGDANKYVSPDCYVVFGVPRGERDNYKVWEEGGHFPM